MPLSKRGARAAQGKGRLRNYNQFKSVQLQVPGKILEQMIKQTIYKHQEDNRVSSSQHGFVKNKSWQTDLIFICDRVIGLLDRKEAVNVIS